MNKVVKDMLAKYDLQGAGDYENALREIFQEIALLGLWRSNFFEHSAFYGGTALRILYGLERFSEDMDFSTLTPSKEFDLGKYCRFIEKELEAWGFSVRVDVKKKKNESTIESAFLKAGTLEQMILVDAPSESTGTIHRNQLLRIKVETDTNPPPLFNTETKYLLNPIPFAVRTYTLPSLFAGKIHALLFRKWKNRVKGRDWYDLVWYAAKEVPLNLGHLTQRMKQTGHWDSKKMLSPQDFSKLLDDRIASLNVDAARSDIQPFLRRPNEVDIWSTDFFFQVAQKITCVDKE
jgi:predicted nucleotidyltransferase component of viral defense system